MTAPRHRQWSDLPSLWERQGQEGGKLCYRLIPDIFISSLLCAFTPLGRVWVCSFDQVPLTVAIFLSLAIPHSSLSLCMKDEKIPDRPFHRSTARIALFSMPSLLPLVGPSSQLAHYQVCGSKGRLLGNAG